MVQGYWKQDSKKGELLAAIDTPEVDQELSQAKASREQIKAALELAKISADRWANLRKTDSVSQQEADQQASGYQQALANLAAADANVRRLEELESFKECIRSVFRRADAAQCGSGGADQFRSASDGQGAIRYRARRSDARLCKCSAGVCAVDEGRGKGGGYAAGISRTEVYWARSLGRPTRSILRTRTLNTEVDVPNKDGKLLPGSFGQVHFATGTSVPRITIPVNAMLFRAEGAQVAVVDKDGKVHLRPISIGRDFGATLEILGGIEVSDQIVINPSDSLEEGQQVHVAKANAGDAHS